MMRVDLLRGLPPSPDTSPSPKPSSGGPLKFLLLVVLILLLAGGALWLLKPEWVPARAVKTWQSVMQGGIVPQQARADSLRRAEVLAGQVSRQIDARQAAVIEWLYQLELLYPEPASPVQGAPFTLGTATFTASGEFLLEGTAASVEALSAVQESMVLIPGMDLRESGAFEIAGSAGPAFDFRFAGVIHSTEGGGVSEVSDSAAEIAVRNRVVEAGSLTAHLESFLRTAAERGLDFAPQPEARVARAGALQAHAWPLKGAMAVARPAASSGPSALAAVRELLELERHRGSPFAIQRITVSERRGQIMVFLDILALAP